MEKTKIQLMLEQEFKIMADEIEDIKVLNYVKRFNFPNETRENIIYHSQYLFSNIDEKELNSKMYIFLDLVVKYHNQASIELLKDLSNRKTSNKREKEKNMIKGIDYIFDYLDGIVNYTRKSKELKNLLRELKSNPETFKGKPPKKYTKENLKTDLRKIFDNKTNDINHFVDELSSQHIIIKNSKM